MANVFIDGILKNSKFRYTLADLSKITNDLAQLHKLHYRMVPFLGKTLMGALFLARMVKDNQKVSIQWKDELNNSVLAYSYRSGKMKGVAYTGEFPNGDIRSNFIQGNGIIKVIRWNLNSEPYTSFTELLPDTVENNLMHFIQKSDQVFTKIYMDCSENEEGRYFVRGLFLQALPDSNSRLKKLTSQLADEVFQGSQIWDLSVEVISDEMSQFMEDDAETLEMGNPYFQCDCSKEKISEVLVSLGKREIDRILDEQGSIEVVCEFCLSKYHYSREEAEDLF